MEREVVSFSIPSDIKTTEQIELAAKLLLLKSSELGYRINDYRSKNNHRAKLLRAYRDDKTKEIEFTYELWLEPKVIFDVDLRKEV